MNKKIPKYDVIAELEKLDNMMYQINATISASFVTRIKKASNDDMDIINGEIANWIKKIREIKEEILNGNK